MKHLLLFCEGMAGEPVGELGGRTPLEIAKTPFMDWLSTDAAVGRASFIPSSLPVQGDVGVVAALGFDPLEFYTGTAPLEALGMGMAQSDSEVIFRCDFVTVSDDTLLDTSAGRISPRESKFLVDELNKTVASAPRIRFHAGEGHRNFLIIQDPELADELDDLECAAPEAFAGEKFVKHLPKGGRSAELLSGLMDRSKKVLESHEINRVRIDLNENPANMIWPWGQGKHPKMPSFKQRHGIDGGLFSQASFAKGIARAVGLKIYDNLSAAMEKEDFVFVYVEAGEGQFSRDLKTQTKRIEMFDSEIVGHAVKMAERFGSVRIGVGTDSIHSLSKGALMRGQVPFLLHGAGNGPVTFNEKSASQSALVFDEGYRLMDHFLKLP